ncbi:uncharacterized protein LOC112560513 isoform X1 [Pomacea canaliculata]|uniref:uncharacterized protein LOC112560513 isoform X1 n=1 Tax=Pomacea canaliculata TaxID=400727 RepID=UPI000D731B0C|nr:uncharacterized protein LOC112560513 isoform X1 [Pomacea canaliculata]
MHVFGGNPSKVSITVAVTTLNTAQVDLHEPNRSVSTINVSLYNSSYFIINCDNNSVLADDMSMNVYRLNSSAEVSVTFFFNGRTPKTKPTAGAMRLIPVDAFGREYYIFTPIIRGQNGYFQLVGVFPNTTVEVYLVLDPQNTTVTFGGVVYRNSDVIYTRVNAYQALQISCYSACTMSGSLVSASKPVAVFSLTDSVQLAASKISTNEDHLMEQLPPVVSYGNLFVTTYGFKNFSLDVAYPDLLYVIASQPNTTVRFDNGSVTDFTLNRAGDVRELFFNDTTVVRTSDPVLCIHVLLNLVKADAAMLVVPAANQFTSEDIFRTVPVVYPNITVHSIHLVAHSFDALGQDVTINTETYPFMLISYSANISVFVVHVSYVPNVPTNVSQSLHVVPKRGTFGGYVFTYCASQQMADISSLAFILEQYSSTCNVSTPQPGDGVDNDCDGITDEEPCFISFWNDTDSDGRYNEDCMPEVSTISSMIDSSAISFETLDTISPTSLLEDAQSVYSTKGLSTGIEITPVLASLTLLSATLSLSVEKVGLLTQDSMRSSLQVGNSVSSYSYVSTATTTSFVELTSADDIPTGPTFSATTISSSTYVSTATMTSYVEMTSSDDTSPESTFSATTMPSYSYDSTVTMTSSVSDVIVASTISPTATSPSTYISAVMTTSSELISSQDIATQSAFSPTAVLPSTTSFSSTSTL